MLNDDKLVRWRHLTSPNNLFTILSHAADAVDATPRVRGIYESLVTNNRRLAVFVWDSRHMDVQKPQDPLLQHSTYSTKNKSNAVWVLTASDCLGVPIYTAPICCTKYPTGK